MAKDLPKSGETTVIFAQLAKQMADDAYQQGKKEENEACASIVETSNARNVKEAAALIRSRVGGAAPPQGVGSYNTGVAAMGTGLE
jgi:hypothetical protein